MARLRCSVALLTFVCLVAGRGAVAQEPVPSHPNPPHDAGVVGTPATSEQAPAHLGFIDGSAEIEREGRSEAAVLNAPILAGDRIRTDASRVEVLFPDGSILHIDNRTVVDVLAGDLLRVLQGRILLVAAGATDPSRMVRYQIDTPAASIQVNRPGQYRVGLFGGVNVPETELAVMHGEATLANQLGSVEVRAGERSLARDSLRPSAPQYFNSARWDAFDRWSQDRQEARTGRRSAQYLPQDLRTYSGDFDRYGSWDDEPTYGNVWYPTVPVGWRPYSNGYWGHYPRYGSLWIGLDLWSWPTHHYGRWGLGRRGTWFWIPGTRWASAWVHWASAPGYVSWCPLGFNDLPVIGHWGVRGVFAGGGIHDPWQAWTVVPAHSFGVAVVSSRVALHGRLLPDTVRSRFVAHRTQPTIGYAVPRSSPRSERLEVAGDRRTAGDSGDAGLGRAVPRGSGRRPESSENRRGTGVDLSSTTPRDATGAIDTRAIRNRFPRPAARSSDEATARSRRGVGDADPSDPSALREPQGRPEPGRGTAGSGLSRARSRDEGARLGRTDSRTPGAMAVPRRREVPGAAAPGQVPQPSRGAFDQPSDARRRFPALRSPSADPQPSIPQERRETEPGSGQTGGIRERRFPRTYGGPTRDPNESPVVERPNPGVSSPWRREIPQIPRSEAPQGDTARPEMPRLEAPRMRFPDRSPALREPQGRPEPSRGTARGPVIMPERGDRGAAPERPQEAAPSRPRSPESGTAAPRQRAPERSPEGAAEGGRARRRE